jgi:hypothetical protein
LLTATRWAKNLKIELCWMGEARLVWRTYKKTIGLDIAVEEELEFL